MDFLTIVFEDTTEKNGQNLLNFYSKYPCFMPNAYIIHNLRQIDTRVQQFYYSYTLYNNCQYEQIEKRTNRPN